MRLDKIDESGTFSLRYRSRLYHIGMGRGLKGRRIVVLVAGRNIRATQRGRSDMSHLGLAHS